ncbi:hypothetical protein AJ80_00318 [Polytolypa hystricis UAMH7299]|uniref:Uncharacterized protein n=1 Tax=Polytolypa hystricis (strain UAMH7299) TaxID=1447883 RepID=A0A2B7Z4U3_POLH7|nr:hypothetical protein AJ80_00318 [Polytolypa hystricis UAMH7299]
MAYPKLPYSMDWRLEEILDAAGVRHCLVGDLVVRTLGFPLIPSSVHLVIADEQLENARSILVASRDYQEFPQTLEAFFDKCATKESTTGNLKGVIANLPSEDQFFLDLFYKVPLRSTRKRVCDQRRRIGAGFITPETARALIPRKDLQLEAITPEDW